MPTWAKVLIIILVIGLLLVVGVVGAGVYWWSNNKDALIAKGKAVISEGQEAGKTTDNQGCVDLAVKRYKTEPGFSNGVGTSVFLQSCLQASAPTENFCSEVPASTEFMKTAEWQLQQCRNVDLGSDQYCRQLFATVQRFCERKTSTSQ
jgi:hypothetical protein